MSRQRTKRDAAGWWFANPAEPSDWIGPYQTKAEMLADKRGVERTVASKKWLQFESRRS